MQSVVFAVTSRKPVLQGRPILQSVVFAIAGRETVLHINRCCSQSYSTITDREPVLPSKPILQAVEFDHYRQEAGFAW